MASSSGITVLPTLISCLVPRSSTAILPAFFKACVHICANERVTQTSSMSAAYGIFCSWIGLQNPHPGPSRYSLCRHFCSRVHRCVLQWCQRKGFQYTTCSPCSVIFPALRDHPRRWPVVTPVLAQLHVRVTAQRAFPRPLGIRDRQMDGAQPPEESRGGRSTVVIYYYAHFLHVLSVYFCFTQWFSIFKSIEVHKYIPEHLLCIGHDSKYGDGTEGNKIFVLQIEGDYQKSE